MEIVRTIASLEILVSRWKQEHQSIGLVPTMGALHEGHLSLVKQAKAQSQKVIVSIFVNPTQFNDPKDLEKYPRTEEDDIQKLKYAQCDAVFIPSVEEVYTQKENWHIDIGYLETILEGASRPGHYQGVTQIVNKLFSWARPDKAFFGQKDYQQVLVIKRMVALLKHELEIVVLPTIRETSGLALSSRNTLLSADARKLSKAIYQVLSNIKANFDFEKWQTLQSTAIKDLKEQGIEVEYLELRDAQTLETPQQSNSIVILIAARVESIRLIDNILL